ncbi:MAG: serine hydrolase [Saprospiraceae bacterium]|nr:serine hydrolase [Saprospiraceae bacterium]
MKKLIYIYLFITMSLFLSSCIEEEITRPANITCQLENNAEYKQNPKSAQLQALIDSYAKKGLPGIVLLVRDENGFYIGSSGKADIKNGIEAQACHISKIASITKLMLATSIFRLQEQGKISVNDPVSKFISKDVLDKIENGNEPLTVLNLLNHTSGIFDVIKSTGFYLEVLNNPSKHWEEEELLKFVYGQPKMFEFNPADTANYSNTNYLLLSMIVEKAAGKSVSQVLHDEIFNPLAMNDSYYFYHDALPEDKIMQGYFDLYNNGTLLNLSNWNTGSGNGYGGVYSTVWDMYLFIDALYAKKTLLTQASLDQMLTFHHSVESRRQLGAGCQKDFIDIGNTEKDFAWGHRGRDLSYSADLFYFPEHKAIMSLMVNYGTDGESELRPVYKEMHDEIAKLIAK